MTTTLKRTFTGEALNRPAEEVQTQRLPRFDDLNGGGQHSERVKTYVEIEQRTASSLQRTSQNSDLGLFILFLSGVTLVLSRYTGLQDVMVGTLAPQEPSQPLIIRGQITRSQTFKEFLEQTENLVLDAFNHAAPDLREFSGSLAPRNKKESREVLAFCFYDELHRSRNNLQGNELLIALCGRGEQLGIYAEYDPRLYDTYIIERLLKNIAYVTGELPRQLNHPLGSVSIVCPEEQEELLSFNQTATDYRSKSTVQELFEEQVAACPNKPAIAFGDTTITYQELNQKANRLAHFIRSRGIQPGDRVALLTDPVPLGIVAIVAIAKAGGSYVPIAPDYPKARKQLMIERVGALLCLATDAAAESLGQIESPLEVLAVDDVVLSTPNFENPLNRSQPEDVLFVPFTSGTTGEPNAVMITHRNVVRLAKDPKWINLDQNDKILSTSPLQFDASSFEIWGALLNGLTLCIGRKEQILDPNGIKALIAKHRVTTLWLTAPLFTQLANADVTIFEQLKTVLTGGDVVSPRHAELVKRQYPALTIINGYGPTENTTFSTTFAIEAKPRRRLPIGKPVPNSTAYIVDEGGNLQPVGAVGKLEVGGDGVALGYLNNPTLTSERFHPLLAEERVYSTGDLARWLPDGNIDFLGRIDDQVKIRGYRIEPREIETALKSNPQVEDALVIGMPDGNGERVLCVYLVAQPNDLRAIKDQLERELPEYMIPSFFIRLDKLPLTPHGKVDRRRLPAPSVGSNDSLDSIGDELQKEMVAIWQEVLGTTNVGIHDDFFDLGGHSMKAIRLISLIHKRLGVKLGLEHVLRSITVADLVRVVRRVEPSPCIPIEGNIQRQSYELSVSQQRLIDLYEQDRENPAFNICQRYTWHEPLDKDLVSRVLASLVERHESLRTCFAKVNGKYVQLIKPKGKVNLEICDLSPLSRADQAIALNKLLAVEESTPFILEEEPLYRVKIARMGDEFDLLWTMHHIVSDGWSMDVLEKEFGQLYRRYQEGKDNNLEPVSVQPKDYVLWHNKLLADQNRVELAQRFWRGLLRNPANPVRLPYDYQTSVTGVGKSSSGYHAVICDETTRRLRALAKAEKTSLFIVLFTAFNLLLHELSGQDDIITGIPSANRHQDGLRNTVGFLVDSVIVRNSITFRGSLSDLLSQVHESTLQSLDHAYYPIELACKSVQLTWPEILSTFFNVSTFDRKTLDDPKWYPIERVQNAKLELVFYLSEYTNGVEINAHYYNELFKASTIEGFMARYARILELLADGSYLIPRDQLSCADAS